MDHKPITARACAEVTLLYVIIAELSVSLSIHNSSTAIVWPSAGIALGAWIKYGPKIWPAVAVASLLGNIHFLIGFDASWGTLIYANLGITAGNIASSGLGWFLISRFTGPQMDPERVRDLVAFFAGAIPAAALAAFCGVAAIHLAGLERLPFLIDWRQWGVSDLVGMLLITPGYLIWSHPRIRPIAAERRLEAIALTGMVLATSLYVFANAEIHIPALSHPYMVLLPLIWAAIRFSPRETTFWSVLTFVVIWLGTSYGFGHYNQEAIAEPMSPAQLFIGIISGSMLLMSAGVQELKLVYRQLRRVNEDLEERVKVRTVELSKANQQLHRFQSIIAHDLKAPVVGFLLGARALDALKPGEDEVRAQLTGSLKDTGEGLTRLLDNLLKWSDLQRGLERPRLAPFDAVVLATECLRTLELSAQEKGVHLEREVQPLHIVGDWDMTSLILRNLLSNALKFSMPGGTVRLEICAVGDHARLAVIDQGIGIDKEIQSLLFRPDIKTSSAGTGGEMGSGLGLLLCSEMATQMGSEIKLSSDVDQGSCFQFSLPLGEEG